MKSGILLCVSLFALIMMAVAPTLKADQPSSVHVQPRLKDLRCEASPVVVPLVAGQPATAAPDVAFDLNDDGALERVSWLADTTRFAFLAIDQNGDGRITSGRELFTERTMPGAANGFDALAKMAARDDGPLKIAEVNQTTSLFWRLLLWTDRNRDGVSQPDELQPVSVKFRAIGLGVYVDGHEGPFSRYSGWARTRGGQSTPVYDVCLVRRED